MRTLKQMYEQFSCYERRKETIKSRIELVEKALYGLSEGYNIKFVVPMMKKESTTVYNHLLSERYSIVLNKKYSEGGEINQLINSAVRESLQAEYDYNLDLLKKVTEANNELIDKLGRIIECIEKI